MCKSNILSTGAVNGFYFPNIRLTRSYKRGLCSTYTKNKNSDKLTLKKQFTIIPNTFTSFEEPVYALFLVNVIYFWFTKGVFP